MRFRSSAFMMLGMVVFLQGGTRVGKADNVTQTQSIGPADTNESSSLSFNKFDSSLGTLNSVTVGMSYSFDHPLITMTFLTPSSITVGAQNQTISLQDPAASTLLSQTLPNFSFPTQSSSGSTFPQTLTFTDSTTPSTGPPQTGSVTPTTLTAPGELALFTAQPGSSTVQLPFFANAQSMFSSSSGNSSGLAETTAAATVFVEYNYTPTAVPEPGSVMLLGLGGGVLFFARQIRQRSTSR